MKITVFTPSEEMIQVEIDKEHELENLKDLCRNRLGIPPLNKCVLHWRGKMLTNPRKSLEEYGFMDGDYVEIFYDEGTSGKIKDEEKTVKIIITFSTKVLELDVSRELELENLKAICESKFDIPLPDNYVFNINERLLENPKMSLKEYGIINGDILQILDDDENARMPPSKEKILKLIITASGQNIRLDVTDILEMENLWAICECRLGIPLSDKVSFKLHDQKLTNPKMRLKDYGIINGDILQILDDEEYIMHIKIITTLGQIIDLDVSSELELENLRAMCECILGIPPSKKCVFRLPKKELTDSKKSLKDYGIVDGDILEMIFNEKAVIKITVITPFKERIDLIVNEEIKLENLKAICKVKLEIPQSKQCFFRWQNRVLWNSQKCLKDYGITDGEILQIVFKDDNSALDIWIKAGVNPDLSLEKDLDFESITVPVIKSLSVDKNRASFSEYHGNHNGPHLEDPKRIWELLLEDDVEKALLKEGNPPLSDALESGSEDRFAEVYNRQQRDRYDKEMKRLQLQNADQTDPDVIATQKEQERLRKVEENMLVAVESVPESLCSVIMMYIDCMVNRHPVKAFVDTGAQMTIMNRSCSERCKIIDLVDLRWKGIAVGVGTQRIFGRIHKVDIEINSVLFPSSFSILEDQPVEMILGLDFIRRNMCTIDLSRNVLQIRKTNGEVVETPFLPEKDIPNSAK